MDLNKLSNNGPFICSQMHAHRGGASFNVHGLTRAEFDQLPGTVEHVEPGEHNDERWEKNFVVGKGTVTETEFCWMTFEPPAPDEIIATA